MTAKTELSTRPYGRPDLLKLTPAEAQARLREHARRGNACADRMLKRLSAGREALTLSRSRAKC